MDGFTRMVNDMGKKVKIIRDTELVKDTPYYGVYSMRRIEKIFRTVFDYTIETAYLNVRTSANYIQKRYVYNVLDKTGTIIYKEKFMYELGDILVKCGLYYGL